MQELRLVPAAAVVWAAALAALLYAPWAGLALACSAGAALLAARQAGQAVLVAGLGAASAAVVWLRLRAARAWEFPGAARGHLSGEPKELDGGGVLLRLLVPGHPGPVAVFVREAPTGAVPGALVEVTGTAAESRAPGTAQVSISGRVDVLEGPRGLAGVAQHVRETFAAAVGEHTGGGARGLIPGMVLGDTSLQDRQASQAYIDAGLSHLSAVSGSNVAIVTTAAVLAASALRLGLRARIAAAGVALLSFAVLVGPEPSVLRASVTGLVALVAVLSSSIAEPVHALCLSVIALILVDTNLAVSYGFALSVAATAGIVAVSPVVYRGLAPLRWPDVLTRALSVAVAADLATMPLVALMAGRVSLVSVAANILVAPVVAPITVLGLVAVVLSLAPGGLEALLLWVIEPLAWWVHAVAVSLSGWSGATVPAAPLTTAVAYGWIVAGLVARRPGATLAAAVCFALAAGVDPPPGREVNPNGLRAHVVRTEEEVEPVPAGAELVVVLEEGRPHARPVRTRSGIPVIFPNRDPPARLYRDGDRLIARAGPDG